MIDGEAVLDQNAGPARATAVDRVEQQLAAMFARVRSGSADAARLIHPDLGTGGYPILLGISEAGPIRVTDLATRFLVGKPTMSRQVASLERLGLVTRQADPTDGRGALVSLSAAGQQAFALARTRRHAWFTERLAGLSDSEVDQLGSLLERFLAPGS